MSCPARAAATPPAAGAAPPAAAGSSGSGDGGRFQQQLEVYGRAGADCRVCRTPIENLYLGGRNTFYCPRCQ